MTSSWWRELAGRGVAELASSPDPRRSCCARAEAVTLIQFSGGAHRGPGGALRVSCDQPAAAHRLVARLAGMAPRVPRVEVATPGASVALGRDEQFGLLDTLGLRRPAGPRLRGLPPAVIHGARCDQAAVWRAALLATAPWTRRRSQILLGCPGPELGLALVGAVRRLGVAVAYRAEVEDTDTEHTESSVRAETSASATLSAVTDPAAAPDPTAAGSGSGVVHASWQAFAVLLAHAGAPATARALRSGPPAPSRRPGLGELGASNQARAVTAAARLVGQARADLEAFEACGQPLPPALAAVAQLRLAHPRASLTDLAARADPPTTKNAVAGKLRRLHLLATGLTR